MTLVCVRVCWLLECIQRMLARSFFLFSFLVATEKPLGWLSPLWRTALRPCENSRPALFLLNINASKELHIASIHCLQEQDSG